MTVSRGPNRVERIRSERTLRDVPYAVLFSAKHAIVDASLGRLLAIVAGGLVLGVVAYRAGGPAGGRAGWRSSAISHVVGNVVAAGLALAAGAL